MTKIGSYERDANKIGSFDRNATKIDSFVNDETKMQTQTNVRSVGLDRLDQDALPLDGRYRYKHTGKGVTVFVMDSGMRLTHQEFQGRATCGLDAVLGQESVIHCEDMFGHGTHVAGIVGGKTVGVAKNVHLVAVKVGGLAPLFPSGSSMLAGLDYILKHKKANPSQPMIVVISIEGSKFQAIDEATVALISSGVTVVVGAGNNGDDACNYSPAGANGAIAVGVSDRSDSVPDWSNYGSCVSMYAPGDAILSAWRRNDTDLDEATGSSQSAPFVAGAAALYLEKDPSMNPKEILHELLKDSLKNILTGGLITNSTELVNITSNRLVHIERL